MNLLETYQNTVRSGDPALVHHFSQIEKQKLVELLVTNKDLLSFIFDKMFKNKKEDKLDKVKRSIPPKASKPFLDDIDFQQSVKSGDASRLGNFRK